MKSRQPFSGLIVSASAAVVLCAPLASNEASAQAQGAGVGRPPAQIQHFDPNGKPPSTFTIELRKGVTATLPFEDKRDFEEAKKGFIAEPPYKQIMADAGNVAWDMGSYQWLCRTRTSRAFTPLCSARPC